jgi:hypothetical protein
MPYATTPEELRKQYPECQSPLMLVFTEHGTGNVAVYYFEGNFDALTMLHCIRQHCYVNGWNCIIYG